MGRALCALAGIGALWAGVAAAAGLATVLQKGRAFAVGTLQVARGDTVRFVNDDTFLHQIFIDSPTLKFESEEQEPGQSIDIRFTKDGTFAVRCHIHPKMLVQVNAR